MKLIIDTNAYVGFKLGYTEVIEYLARAGSVLVSPIVLGELLFGFRGGARFDKNMEELNRFLAHPAVEIIPLTEITSDRYSRIAARLKQQGTPIPSNDIWIAAQTMESGAELVTMDHHFQNISNLVYRLFNPPH
ncbi:MAG: type II toxin-antitoxin system VapC family toxin [Thermodesulfobacteriota bacterium]|nr:type II toxin-antitoxin system VapC family toxin [Thermodesulfobacteriota bacterium]